MYVLELVRSEFIEHSSEALSFKHENKRSHRPPRTIRWRFGLQTDDRYWRGGENSNGVTDTAVAGAEEMMRRAGGGGACNKWRPGRVKPETGSRGSGDRSSIRHCAESRSTRHRDRSHIEADGGHAPLLPPGAGPGSRRAARLARSGEGGGVGGALDHSPHRERPRGRSGVEGERVCEQ